MIMSEVDTFFELLRVGLWEKDANDLGLYKGIDWEEVCRLATEQSVVGLIAAGIDKLPQSQRPPQEKRLQIIGEALQLEQQNKAMNQYLAGLIQFLRNNGVYALLVKGQGVAQSYERPLWRACGDIDLFLSTENYERAKELLLPQATRVEKEGNFSKHLGMTIDGWCVELHGTLRNGLSKKVVKGLDEIQYDTIYHGNVRSWNNNGVQIFMMGIENEIVYVFTHFLRHFYKGGIGLRQICDWCRLLWKYRGKINMKLLEKRVQQMELMSEWRAFATVAVNYLGMPKEAMPFYEESNGWDRKAKRIVDFILMSGNFGHNRDMSYIRKYPFVVRKTISLGRRLSDALRHLWVFPMDTLRFFPYIMWNGMRSAVRGEG